MDPLLKSLSDDQLGGLIREQRPEWALPLGRGRPEVAAPYNEEGPPLPARMQELRGGAAEAYTRTQDPAQGQRSFFRQALDAVLALGDARAREKLPRPYDVAEGFLNPVPGVAGVLMGAKGAKALGPNTEIKYLLGRKALDEGEAPQAVWSKYGVSKTPEGAYVFEAPLMEGETDAIRQFMQAYPNVALRVLRGQGPREGYYYDKSPEIFAQGKTTGPITDFDSRRRVLEHELQHAADAAEGHSYGTNLQDPNYMKNAAEVRARAVEERLDPRERVWEPSFHEDVDRLDQVIKRHPGAVSEAVKEKGGMWYPEAVKRLAEPLNKQLLTGTAQHYVGHIEGRSPGDYRGILRAEALNPDGSLKDSRYALAAEDIDSAIAASAWSDRAIRNYLNKHAGTATDPLRDVEIPFGEGVKRWEELTDNAFESATPGAFPLEQRNQLYALKTPSNEKVWYQNPTGQHGRAIESYLSHVGDYLRQNVPAEKLQQYDLVRAVKETAANDARVAKGMEKAAQASMKDLPVYKEYPDGMKWVELKKPEKLTEEQAKRIRQAASPDRRGYYGGYEALGPDGRGIRNTYTGEVAQGRTPEEAYLAGRLAEEGNQMGHCVGGYCEGVAAGESRIFSLRDKKGKSHVTIETQPQWTRPDASRHSDDPASGGQLTGLESIAQIKGKQNRAPNAEYLPYVQDFVRSGKWGEVKDLLNAGLMENPLRTRNSELERFIPMQRGDNAY